MTAYELYTWLRKRHAHHLANELLNLKTEHGYYLLAHDDPIAGPYSGDKEEAWHRAHFDFTPQAKP